jgi:hypothetical protein
MLPCVMWLRTRLPTEEGSGATMCPTALQGPWAPCVQENATGLALQLSSRVPKAHVHS